MKSKNKTIAATKNSKLNEEQRRETRKRLWMRLAAIFMVIVFLAGECSTLIMID